MFLVVKYGVLNKNMRYFTKYEVIKVVKYEVDKSEVVNVVACLLFYVPPTSLNSSLFIHTHAHTHTHAYVYY